MAALVTPASVVSELMARGRESAAALEALLQGTSASPSGAPHELAAEILRCWDRALAALHAAEIAGSDGRNKRKPPGAAATDTRPKRRPRASGGRDTPPARVEEKRTVDDGYVWRKYGQKEILNSSHPRLYFRCSYKHDRGCPATRHVQHSDHDPSLYVVTYFGHHTCCVGGGDAAAHDLLEETPEPAPFVIDFGSGSGSGSSGSLPWLSSSSEEDDDGGRSCEMTKQQVESTALADETSCSSPAWDVPLPVCSSDWDYCGESSFDYITELINRYEISMFQ